VNFALDADSAEVFRLARFENSDAAFFSRRVVLFEGESDDAYCKHIARLLRPEWDFDKHNIALVRVSGKGNFSRYRKFFEAFGIEVKVIADLDALFEGHGHLGVCAAAAALRTNLMQQLDARVAELGIRAQPTARQIKARVQQDSWRERYDAARAAVEHVQATGALAEDTMSILEELFVWEAPIARMKACREDGAARQYLVPTLDAFRAVGICVLSRGAIEDYYPEGAPSGGPKPDRALAAARMVTSPDMAQGLSDPLADGRQPELYEIFGALID
jgi:hypothetical protein